MSPVYPQPLVEAENDRVKKGGCMLQSMKVILVMVLMTILSREQQPAHAGAAQAPATSQGYGSTVQT